MLKMILTLHIAAGSVALASMFVPMVTRKGGTVHRRTGWVFVWGMTIVSITALILAGARIVTNPSPNSRAFAYFLFYVAILTAAGVSTGIRVLRTKQRTGPHHGPWDIGIAALLVVSAVGMAIYGITSGRPLLMAFSVVGLIGGGSDLAYWLRPPSHRMHWWFQHMGGMLGSCIAATTAFLVLNAGRMGAPIDSIVIWLAPTIVGVPAIALWTAYYRRKFASVAAAPRGTSRSTPAAVPYTPSHTV